MTAHRRGPLLVGGLLFVLGIAMLLVRGIANLVSVDWLVDQLGHDYLVIAGFGLVALFLALLVILARSLYGFEQATPPTAESVPTGVPLGAQIDHVVEQGLHPYEHVTGRSRATVRDRLRQTAIETVRRVDGCSSAAARAAVSAGEWTDDQAAAAFLADEGPAPLAQRLRDALPRGSRFQDRTARAVTAILERDEQGGDR
ncbi:hypothetical protein ACFR9U_17840 [Halorientalis brevis]|uniref:Uncharacterized protein n=1 Tax=Halorientalis brevis TaxID=1126241 RepID=A0ABD6CGA1_9EURY|nr:hypothetical protein [Halorientalis brevis]